MPMTLPQRHGFDVDGRGHLLIGGVDAADLAARFGTPLHVIDETRMRANCREFVEAMAHAQGETVAAPLRQWLEKWGAARNE